MPVILRVVLIFLLVALVAGGIAMLGNQLGRKIGRRKMTVFGMRPRHTSIFITTITGSIIAVLTLGIAMAGSENVRILITGSQEKVQKLQQRENQLLDRVRELAEEVRRGTIIWNYEERIALNTIPAGAEERAVANIIGVSLQQANYLSIDKNNKISLRQREKLFGADEILVKYSDEELRQWISKYSGLEESVGIWIVVTENCLWKDQVPVTVETFPVAVVYRKGEVVYTTELVASEVLLDWHVFLKELKEAALRKGMIEMNDSLGGVIEEPTLIAISKTIDRHGGKIRLRAVANRDLYQSSNLDVSIEVEPVVE